MQSTSSNPISALILYFHSVQVPRHNCVCVCVFAFSSILFNLLPNHRFNYRNETQFMLLASRYFSLRYFSISTTEKSPVIFQHRSYIEMKIFISSICDRLYLSRG